VPVDTLRTFLLRYAGADVMILPDAIQPVVEAAYASYLVPTPGSQAAALMQATRYMVDLIPIVTAHGSRLSSISRAISTWKRADEMRDVYDDLTFTYDDGVSLTTWADMGDHGTTLITTADGTPSFYCVMTSDCRYETDMAAKRAGLSYSVVDRLQEIEDRHLGMLVGDIDPSALARLPRVPLKGRPDPQPLRQGMSLSQLYAAPPSPKGRAPLGRRS